MIYGMDCWRDFFTSRQALALSTLVKCVQACGHKMADEHGEGAGEAVQSVLSLALDRQVDASSSLCRWHVTREIHTGTFGRQAIPMVWDFSEVNVFSNSTGGFPGAIEWVAKVCETVSSSSGFEGHAEKCSATAIQLPDDTAHALITDPPYYDAVPYAYLSDFFYVWLRRTLSGMQHALLSEEKVPKDPEIVVDRPHELSNSNKTIAFYESELTKAFAEARRVLRPNGIGTIVFASKTTASWEAILQAVVEAGWIVTGSWPIDTEMEARVAAQGQARLASSVHLVCRPRENSDGSLVTEQPGEWRDVLQELPGRIHDWLPRLAHEGIVGADAIFACLGPALEIFSRYSRVERADDAPVLLREYLEQVWAAVAKEALSLLFKDADAAGLEPDARLTAMWLWTLRTETSDKEDKEVQEVENEDEEDDKAGKSPAKGGFVLEFDAARKIAQGLGANMEELRSVVEVKGQTARLLPVGERAVCLLGKPSLGIGSAPAKGSRKARTGFLPGMEDVKKGKSRASDEGGDGDDVGSFGTGTTTLDRIHQSMLLFARGRADALKRFLVDDGIGKDSRFWKLAQSLSALYPPGTDEKRWVDGVLARKKGLGL
jgi:adenine-specific DNA methylase